MMVIEKNRRNKGFTLAEAMIVVAIIMILGLIATVNVVQHQRSMAGLERDGVAREIFVAAQTHLTAAESQGYLGIPESGFGTPEGDGIYYLIYPTKDTFATSDSILYWMLPFGSVDETVRLGGSYIIRYHKDTAQVLDVFYCSRNNMTSAAMTGKFNTVLDDGDYKKMYTNKKTGESRTFLEYFSKDGDAAQNRLRFEKNDNDYVLGWYGGVDLAALSKIPLDAVKLKLRVHNEEMLWVEVIYDYNSTALPLSTYYPKLSLRVKSDRNDNPTLAELPLKNGGFMPTGRNQTITSTLDDITTSDGQFYNNTLLSGFIPGENLTIQAELEIYENYIDATHSGTLAKIAFSNIETTNSLFGDGSSLSIDSGNKLTGTAQINNFRHLENLSQAVSHIEASNSFTAEQTTDLYWKDSVVETKDFVSRISQLRTSLAKAPNSVKVYYSSGSVQSVQSTEDGYYYPVSPNYALTYNGKTHSIYNVTVNTTGDAGLFGELKKVVDTPSQVSNLQLVDFSITGTTSAGALAGTLDGATVKNVLARNSGKSTAVNISATAGDAGGLVGDMTGGSIERSAAALTVSGSGNAGGLIGSAGDDTMIIACYSGGHTVNGKYDSSDFNVSTTGTTGSAGGLVGTFSGTKIESSYSTCSASGATAGGLVGSATAGTITNCYATGLVSGDYAFIGSGSPTLTGNYFYSIINQKPPIAGNSFTDGNIKALDGNAKTYNDFVGNLWNSASAYDSKLIQYYQGKYNLKTVAQLLPNDSGISIGSIDFVYRHYGDWPAPEVFIPNVKTATS